MKKKIIERKILLSLFFIKQEKNYYLKIAREKNASSFSFFYKARKELLFKNCIRQL